MEKEGNGEKGGGCREREGGREMQREEERDTTRLPRVFSQDRSDRCDHDGHDVALAAKSRFVLLTSS